ncbi:MAG: metallophosphoesterase family protein [Sphaerobacter sp.]|nr:metallophosphoesterase family protein [Sphaerobacter sp.]
MPAPDQFETFAAPIVVGVVSDTHITARRRALPAPLVEGLRGVDLILHAGDLTSAHALALLEAIAPVRAVIGNNDEPELRLRLPRIRYFRFGGFTVGLMHGHDVDHLSARQAAGRTLVGRVDVAIFGHSHQPLCEWRDGTLLFNPGSPTAKRWQPRFSYGIIRFADVIEPELRFFDWRGAMRRA